MEKRAGEVKGREGRKKKREQRKKRKKKKRLSLQLVPLRVEQFIIVLYAVRASINMAAPKIVPAFHPARLHNGNFLSQGRHGNTNWRISFTA